MIRSFSIYIIIPLLMFTVSCSDNNAPKDLIDEDPYVEIFSELVVINQILDEQIEEDMSRDQLIEQVFEKHGVTEDQFNMSHYFYQRQPDRQLERLSRVEEKLKLERDDFQERLNEYRKNRREAQAAPDTL